ncbi:MAG: hypothetical protein HY820_14965 [Acidobacteria bacterium]|nr:hypothetical protein [Acidobacteriota bacterium]
MSSPSRRRLLLSAPGLVCAALAQTRPDPKAVMARFNWGEGKLKPGDPAPDFTLKEQKTGESVTLSRFRDVKPVALVFGSFT